MKPLHNDGKQDEVISRLEAEGFLVAAADRAPMPRWKGRSIKGKSMAETVSEEREHR